MSAFIAPVSSRDDPARPAGAWRPARCRENSRRLGLGHPAFGAGAAIPCSFISLLSVPVRKQQHEQHNHEHEEREPRFVRGENRNPGLSDLELLKNMSTQNTGVKLPTAATNAQLAGTEGLG